MSKFIPARRPLSLTEGPVGRILTQMSIPTILGILAILTFNLIDTYFISLIGAKELAAVSYTFPISFVLLNVSMGIGIGTTTCLSTRFGSGQTSEANIIGKHAVLLAFIVAVSLSALGVATIEPIFKAQGASDATIPLIDDYMRIWYLGIPLLFLPMVGNAAIRATGDTLTPSLIMMMAGFVNGLLDPLLIFGFGPFPAMGIQGAAIATVLSWFLASVAVIWQLLRLGVLKNLFVRSQQTLIKSWRSILTIGIPAGATNLIPTLAAILVTRLVAELGDEAVAGFGVGTRVEAVAMVIVMGISSALSPFIGQNYGAGKLDRIRTALLLGVGVCCFCEVIIAALLLWCAPYIAQAFSNDPAVIKTATQYLYCLPISYAFQAIIIATCSALNALHHPILGTVINFSRLLILAVPAAWIGLIYWGQYGIFIAITVTQVIAGIVTLVYFSRWFERLRERKITP